MMDGVWQTKRQVLTMLKSVDPNEVGRDAPAEPLAPVGRRLPHALLERALGGRLSLPVRSWSTPSEPAGWRAGMEADGPCVR